MSTSHTPFTEEQINRINSIRNAARAIQPIYEKMEKGRTYGFELAENIAHKFWVSKIKRGLLDYLIKIKDNHAFVEAVEMLDGKELSEKRSLEISEKKSLIPFLEKLEEDAKDEKKHSNITDDVYLAGLQEIIKSENFAKDTGTLRKLCKGFHLTLDTTTAPELVAASIQQQAEEIGTSSESKMCLELCGISLGVYDDFKQKSHDQLKSQKETLEAKLDKTQKDLATAKTELASEKETSSARKTELARLEKEVKEKNDDNEKLTTETASLREQLSTQVAALQKKHDAELSSQTAAQKQKFNEQLQQLNKQLAEKEVELQRQQRDIANSRAREESLRRSLEASKTEAKETKTKLEATNAQQALDLKQLKSEADALKASNERLKNKLAALETINQRLLTDEKKHTERASRLHTNLATVEQEHEKQTKAFNDAKADNQLLQARITAALAEISQLQRQLDCRETTVDHDPVAVLDSIVSESPPAVSSVQNRNHTFSTRPITNRTQPLPQARQGAAKKATTLTGSR